MLDFTKGAGSWSTASSASTAPSSTAPGASPSATPAGSPAKRPREGPQNGWAKKHGYVFFLPKDAQATVDAEPLKALGRMAHEAVVADPRTGVLYDAEDAGSGRGSGFYRFVPAATEDLGAGGTLQMVAVLNRPQADLREGQTEHRPLPVRWVDITDVNRLIGLTQHGETFGLAVNRLPTPSSREPASAPTGTPSSPTSSGTLNPRAA